MSYVGLSILSIVVIVIETTLLEYMKIGSIKPDIILLVVIYYGFYSTKTKAVSLGFVVGLIQDSLTFVFFGFNATTKCLTGFFVATMKENFLSENIVIECLVSFFISIVSGLFFVTLEYLISGDNVETISMTKLFFSSCYNIIFIPPIFFLLHKANNYFNKIKSGYGKL